MGKPPPPNGESVFVFTATSPTSPAVPPPPPAPPLPPFPEGRKRRHAVGFCFPPEEVVSKGEGLGEGEMGADDMAMLAQQLELDSDNVSTHYMYKPMMYYKPTPSSAQSSV